MMQAPLLVKFIFAQSVFCIFYNLVYCYYTFCNKIDSFDLRYRRNVASLK